MPPLLGGVQFTVYHSYATESVIPKKGQIEIPGTGTYIGELDEYNKPHGKGVLTYLPSDKQARIRYEGEFNHGVRQGEGVMQWIDQTHRGTFLNNAAHGTGTRVYHRSGRVETCEWEKGNSVEEKSSCCTIC